ncbi:hypothetical protein [Sphingomicrobium flavum]|uniref:hypothetical protein n=1 Tax=Sphingomicrobium flavum TaxID=1229164 RepID=UPI0021AD64E7|nr:hypothetical protein [Sphingomicrobium flavum]
MNKFLICTALMALGACARVEPIDDNALDELDTLPSPSELANAAAATEGGTPGLRFAWLVDEPANAVIWGPQGQPPDADPRLSIRCNADDDQPQLVITHYAQGDRETGVGTLRVSGNGSSASLPVAVLEEAGGAANWTANVDPGNLLDSLDDTFGGIGLVNVSLSGAQTLQVDASDAVRSVFDSCGANAPSSQAADSDSDSEQDAPVEDAPAS